MNWHALTDHGRPAIIAHGAGNLLTDIEAAGVHGADAVEADVYAHAGDFEARHERAIYPIPLWLERWYVKLAPRTRFRVSDMLAGTSDRLGLFLDVKSGADIAPGVIARALTGPYAESRIAISSPFWYIIRRIVDEVPNVAAFYSVDVQSALDLFLSVLERDPRPVGVSCRHTLLTPALVDELHGRGCATVAWTVDDPARARELAGWGVDAITTNNVEAIRAALVAGQ